MKKIIYIIITFLCVFGFNYNVKASTLENCTNNTKYIDYTDVYQSLGNNQQLKQFYTDFKDWFDSQSDYLYYYMFAQGGSDNLIHYYVTLFNDNQNYNQFIHSYSTRYRNFTIGFQSSNNSFVSIRHINNTDLVFDSLSFASGMTPFANFTGGRDSLPYQDSTFYYNFDWVYTNYSSTKTNGSLIFIDTNNTMTLIDTDNYINIKVNDDYYCSNDPFPKLNDVYPLYVKNTTENSFFEKATNTMIGLINITTSFYDSLWNENTGIGKFLCTIGLVNVAVSLCYILFLRRHRV